MLLAPHVPYIPNQGAYVRMAADFPVTRAWDMGCFGDNWGVRREAGGTLLGVNSTGKITNQHGHPLAASLSGIGSPSGAAAEGTLYIQY
jgi:hypothetical protein